MNKILEQLEQEEIMDYKKELKQYLDEIPDQYFYEFFHIRSMTDPVYDGISQDLMSRDTMRCWPDSRNFTRI